MQKKKKTTNARPRPVTKLRGFDARLADLELAVGELNETVDLLERGLQQCRAALEMIDKTLANQQETIGALVKISSYGDPDKALAELAYGEIEQARSAETVEVGLGEGGGYILEVYRESEKPGLE